ncbi:hypothetical protein BY996DRAFT_7959453 [Phakopsora pachyrhizi]|nr:hypothetical protein BY996DRAFT_7959453 [Phakopsora pachyrhizi]
MHQKLERMIAFWIFFFLALMNRSVYSRYPHAQYIDCNAAFEAGQYKLSVKCVSTNDNLKKPEFKSYTCNPNLCWSYNKKAMVFDVDGTSGLPFLDVKFENCHQVATNSIKDQELSVSVSTPDYYKVTEKAYEVRRKNLRYRCPINKINYRATMHCYRDYCKAS